MTKKEDRGKFIQETEEYLQFKSSILYMKGMIAIKELIFKVESLEVKNKILEDSIGTLISRIEVLESK